jgi:hypothetical protein
MSVCHHNKSKLLNYGTLENEVICALNSHSVESHYATQYSATLTSRWRPARALSLRRHVYSGLTELVKWNKQSAKHPKARPFPTLAFDESELIFRYDYLERNGLLIKFNLIFDYIRNVKVVPLRSIETHLGERRYSSYPFLTSALEGVNGQNHAPAVLYPRGKSPPYPLYRRLGGPQSRSGRRG